MLCTLYTFILIRLVQQNVVYRMKRVPLVFIFQISNNAICDLTPLVGFSNKKYRKVWASALAPRIERRM